MENLYKKQNLPLGIKNLLAGPIMTDHPAKELIELHRQKFIMAEQYVKKLQNWIEKYLPRNLAEKKAREHYDEILRAISNPRIHEKFGMDRPIYNTQGDPVAQYRFGRPSMEYHKGNIENYMNKLRAQGADYWSNDSLPLSSEPDPGDIARGWGGGPVSVATRPAGGKPKINSIPNGVGRF